jgi:outer membrane lipoprotein-sorting protein
MAFLLCLLLLLTPALASAMPLPLPATLQTEPLPPAESAAAFKQLDAYVKKLTTLSARFTQTNADGSELHGTFDLQRPGRLRLEYDPPPRWLFVGTGNSYVYYDADVKQVSYLGRSDLPLAFLLEDDATLNRSDLKFTFYEDDTMLYALSRYADNPPATFAFQKNPFQLAAWYILDQEQQLITVTLQDVSAGKPLDAALFRFVDPNRPR